MMSALVVGHLRGEPTKGTASNGAPYARARLRVAVRGGETVTISVITFASDVIAALSALQDGDAVALSGELTPSAWLDRENKPRPGLDLFAHSILTEYAVAKKRRAMQSERESQPHREPFIDDDLSAIAGTGR